jgi:dTDP-glucose pyrophosphorylase
VAFTLRQYKMGYIEREQLIKLAQSLSQISYGDYLLSLAKESEHDRD